MIEQASWETIEEKFLELYPPPHMNRQLLHTFRNGWQTCERHVSEENITYQVLLRYVKYMNEEYQDPNGEHQIPPMLLAWLIEENNRHED